jgi:hypothetical protein
MNCEGIRKLLPLFLYSELSFDEEEAVHQHVEGCDACRRELAVYRRVHQAVDDEEPQVDTLLLSSCRRQLRTTVSHIEHIAPRPRVGFRSFLGSFAALWDASWVKPVAAMALLAVGFFAGRAVQTPDTQQLIASGDSEPVMTRVRFVEPGTSGRVRLVLEETSQRTLSGGADDESIRQLLIATARDASDPGLRVESMDLLKTQGSSSEVRRALIYAVQHDPNSGVRLKALEGLRGFAHDAEARKALAEVLLTDENPGVRTQAIDLLMQKKEPAMVGMLQELITKEDNNYVRLRCQKALHEMNASVETF